MMASGRGSNARRARSRLVSHLLRMVLCALCGSAPAANAAAVSPQSLVVVGDGIPDSIAGAPGDAARGRALIVAREAANCVLCHAVPEPTVRFAGNLGPSLAGVGARMSVAQMRLRVADSQRLDPSIAMPSYYRTTTLDRVAPSYAGKPVLTATEVEDVVAYLATLK